MNFIKPFIFIAAVVLPVTANINLNLMFNEERKLEQPVDSTIQTDIGDSNTITITKRFSGNCEIILKSSDNSGSSFTCNPVEMMNESLQIVFDKNGIILGNGFCSQNISLPMVLIVKYGKDKIFKTKLMGKTAVTDQAENVPEKTDRLVSPNISSQDKFTGCMVYDALQMKKKMKSQVLISFLSYYNDHNNDPSKESILSAYKSNPFIDTTVLKDMLDSPLIDKGIQSFTFLSPENLLSSAGNFDVTTSANAMADFLVKRAKTELALVFFDKFKKAFLDSSCKDLKVLFPQTYASILVLGDEIYNYQIYMQTLRTNFQKDLDGILINLPKIKDNYPAYFSSHLDQKILIDNVCYLGENLKNGTHPGMILENYPDDTLPANWKYLMKTAQIISSSLRDTVVGQQHYWINTQQANKLLCDSTALTWYMGFLYQKASRQPGGDSLAAIIRGFKGNYSGFAKNFGTIINSTNRISEIIKSKSYADKSITDDCSPVLTNACLDLLQAVNNLGVSSSCQSTALKKTFTQYSGIINYTVNLTGDLRLKNYSAAVSDLAGLWGSVMSLEQSVDSIRHTDFKTKCSKTDTADTVRKHCSIRAWITGVKLNRIEEEKEKDFKNIVITVLKYGTFMASMCEAKSAQEVEQLIENFSLPAGSSRVKRASAFTFGLNAYVGAFTGYEQIKGHDKKFELENLKLNTYGITAPVGLSLSFTNPNIRWLSISPFFSIIDLGALAAIRFNDSSTEQFSSVKLKDIFSPGLFLSLGVLNIPLSVNIGAQVYSNYHASNTGNDDLLDALVYRYSASVCVDIPIAYFYVSGR